MRFEPIAPNRRERARQISIFAAFMPPWDSVGTFALAGFIDALKTRGSADIGAPTRFSSI